MTYAASSLSRAVTARHIIEEAFIANNFTTPEEVTQLNLTKSGKSQKFVQATIWL